MILRTRLGWLAHRQKLLKNPLVLMGTTYQVLQSKDVVLAMEVTLQLKEQIKYM
jgi:hypothetical protein